VSVPIFSYLLEKFDSAESKRTNKKDFPAALFVLLPLLCLAGRKQRKQSKQEQSKSKVKKVKHRQQRKQSTHTRFAHTRAPLVRSAM
jgi:hypothetical protein